MKLYNTLTRQAEEFLPLSTPGVTVYTCGPTVYDYAHIGHWYTYVRWDTVIRTLKVVGMQPKWVMNITDVGHLVSDADDGEDKLEKGAKREGKTAWEVADFYTADFLEGMRLLNITAPDFLTKATEHIPEQIALIQNLESKGYTYTIDDGVYYDTSKFEGYADFARLDLDDLQEGARVEINKQKRNPSDFALWKFSPSDHQRDMEWESPWGTGFPGWHIECSAMAMKYLGETIDIHAGGIDHIPVHHSNEIAQSEAATGRRFANYWLHSNHVTVNGEKISKSLGNGIRIQELLARGIPAEAVRLNILESNYRSQSKFSWESLEAAHNRLKDLRAWADLRHQGKTGVMPTELDELFRDTKTAIMTALENDLNTPQALMVLSGLVNHMADIAVPSVEGEHTPGMLALLDQIFGLNLADRPDISNDQKQLIQDREAARDAKDWPTSDEIRAELTAQGLGLRDTQHGAYWFRLTT